MSIVDSVRAFLVRYYISLLTMMSKGTTVDALSNAESGAPSRVKATAMGDDSLGGVTEATESLLSIQLAHVPQWQGLLRLPTNTLPEGGQDSMESLRGVG